MRRSYEELKEQTEEEKVITERQVRAYKKQVDELSEKLTEANDKTKLVQDRCDELVKVETERNEMKAKVCVTIMYTRFHVAVLIMCLVLCDCFSWCHYN